MLGTKDRPRHALEEVVLPFPAALRDIPCVTEFRSTWIVSSLAGLRANGYLEQYRAALPPHAAELLSCVAGSWLPVQLVREHYLTCQTLGLDQDDLLRMALSEGGNVRRTWHANVIGAAQRATSSPWEVLSQLHKLWLRGANGGAVAVYRAAEGRARVHYVGCELFDISYFRNAVRAVLTILADHVCADVNITTLPQQEPGETSFLLQWSAKPPAAL